MKEMTVGMKELVAINKQFIGGEEINSVDARELHTFLESKRDFSNWVKAKVVENPFFKENVDFILLANIVEQDCNTHGGHNRKDYALTLDTAKKVAMAEQTAKGEEVRDYFIQCEKKLKEVILEQQKPKEIPHWSIEANGIEHVLGMLKAPAHIIASEMVKHVLNVGGPDLRGTIKELPCSQNIKDDEVMLEPTSLGKHFGLKASAMNKKLRDLDLQYHDGTGWIPTEKGSKISARNYCASEANSWTGYNYKWNLKAVKHLIKEI